MGEHDAKSPGGNGQTLFAATDIRLAPGLYVVATPIGNPRDITLRALDTLRAVDAIYAEDTRRTGRLLAAHGIDTPQRRYHDHNAREVAPRIVAAIQGGEAVALVSDAGTPLVSDPGFRAVRAAARAGLPVHALPGPSAAVAALSVAGLPSDRFTFAGFLPPKRAARRTAIAELATAPGTLILYATAARVADVLSDLAEGLGARDGVLARELTKTYEQVRRGTLAELVESVADDPPRGEIVLLIAPPIVAATWDAARIDAALRAAISEHGVKRASAMVAEESGWAKREVYARALKL